jgi:hypothetical protein
MEYKLRMKLLEKKIKSLFNVNYNKSAKSYNPCIEACEKVDKKINGHIYFRGVK